MTISVPLIVWLCLCHILKWTDVNHYNYLRHYSAENIESMTHSRKMILIVFFSNLIIFSVCEPGTTTNSKAPGTQKSFSIKEEEIKRKPIMELNERNFDKVTSKGHTFIKFYAPWCGHCKQMEPDWKEVGEFVTRNPIENIDLTIGEVICFNVL